MVTTELKPLILNLSDEDPNEEEESTSPVFPMNEDSEDGDGPSGTPERKTGVEDGFDLDDDLIENPGEEDF